VSFEVAPGSILGLIGPSGAGKTSIIHLLTGLVQASSGMIRVLSEDPRHFHRQTRERIGYMPQQFVLYPDLTAEQNVGFVASLFGLLYFRRRRRTREVLQLLDLWDARDRQAKHLSGGMQRRLELVCALVHSPSLMFIDEPTAGIDPVLRQDTLNEFRRLRDSGCTMFVTTQYVSEAEYCDMVAMLADGRLIALAEPEQLRHMAFGGDLLEVELENPFDGARLRGLPGIRYFHQQDLRTIRLVTRDAGETTPKLVEAIRPLGGEVVSVREYRPSFDEVFAEILASHNPGSMN
jgi:ABC-2 type transport system ATP-binding protein